MAASNFVNVTSPQHFKDLLSADLNRVSCLNFWAPWAEPCAAFTKAVERESCATAGEAGSVRSHGCVADTGERVSFSRFLIGK
jgi:thioredoxin-like negative regulator of GroEL